MGLELINGAASEVANEDSSEFFAGTTSPRRYRISEAMRDKADTFLEDMFAGRKSQHQIAEAFASLISRSMPSSAGPGTRLRR